MCMHTRVYLICLCIQECTEGIYRFAIRKRAFNNWKIAMERRMRIQATKLHTVVLPFRKRVLNQYYFNQWKWYVLHLKQERELQLRTDLTWNKVQGWLHKK